MTTAYRDWQDRKIQVSDQTLEAVLAVLGAAPPPARARPGRSTAGSEPLAAPWHPADHPAAPSGPRSGWGFTVQLYSVRSRHSWGHGDLRDLADLAAWSGRELGAAFVLINPLHAAEPLPPVSASPYLPMSRRFLSPLYLRVEDIPEYALLPSAQRQQIAALAAPLRAGNSSPALIDRDAVWAAKRAALEIVQAQPLAPARRAAFRRFAVREGQALDDWATWCALAEIHGPDWRSWPSALRSPRSAAVAAERTRLHARIEFHSWLQWAVQAQRAAAQAAARAAGMSIGVIGDLAVGAHPGGADAWALCGRAGGGHERGRAARRVQPAWPELGTPAVASRPAGGGRLPAAGGPGQGRVHRYRRTARRPRDGPVPALVGARRHVCRPGHLRPVPARGHGRAAGRRGGPGRRGRDRRGPGHRRAVDARLPGGPPGARHVHALVRAAGRRHAAAAAPVAPGLPGDRGHARRAARGRVSHRRARGAAVPARPAHRVPGRRARARRGGGVRLAGRPGRAGAASTGRRTGPGGVHPGAVRLPRPDPGRPDRCVARRRRGRPPAAEPAGHHRPVPELAGAAV